MLYLGKTSIYQNESTMIWGSIPNLGTTPTTGHEINVKKLWSCESNDSYTKLKCIDWIDPIS